MGVYHPLPLRVFADVAATAGLYSWLCRAGVVFVLPEELVADGNQVPFWAKKEVGNNERCKAFCCDRMGVFSGRNDFFALCSLGPVIGAN